MHNNTQDRHELVDICQSAQLKLVRPTMSRSVQLLSALSSTMPSWKPLSLFFCSRRWHGQTQLRHTQMLGVIVRLEAGSNSARLANEVAGRSSSPCTPVSQQLYPALFWALTTIRSFTLHLSRLVYNTENILVEAPPPSSRVQHGVDVLVLAVKAACATFCC